MGIVPFVAAIEQFEIDPCSEKAMACRYFSSLVKVYSASEMLAISCLLKDRCGPGSPERKRSRVAL